MEFDVDFPHLARDLDSKDPHLTSTDPLTYDKTSLMFLAHIFEFLG